MCFFSDGVEVRLDGQMVRLEFCVDGEAVVQVAVPSRVIDAAVADYLTQRESRDGQRVNIHYLNTGA